MSFNALCGCLFISISLFGFVRVEVSEKSVSHSFRVEQEIHKMPFDVAEDVHAQVEVIVMSKPQQARRGG